MDILERLLGHDAWTTGQLLERCRELMPAQMQQRFDIGHENLLDSFDHLIGNIEVWTDLMLQHPMPIYAAEVQAERETLEGMIARYEVASHVFGKLALQLAAEQKLDECYSDFLDDPPRLKSFGGTIAHVLTHNHSHRTEIIHMLTHLGVKDVIEGDVLGWESVLRANAEAEPPTPKGESLSFSITSIFVTK